jgi:hypothetical protein
VVEGVGRGEGSGRSGWCSSVNYLILTSILLTPGHGGAHALGSDCFNADWFLVNTGSVIHKKFDHPVTGQKIDKSVQAVES